MANKGGRPRSADPKKTLGLPLPLSIIALVEEAADEAGRGESPAQYLGRVVESTFRKPGDRPASRKAPEGTTPRPVRKGCSHPRSKRQVTPYFSRCGACGARL